MSDDDTNDFVAELEKQAAEFEERAKFWESKQGTVTGLQVQVEGGVWGDDSGKRHLPARRRDQARIARDLREYTWAAPVKGSR